MNEWAHRVSRFAAIVIVLSAIACAPTQQQEQQPAAPTPIEPPISYSPKPGLSVRERYQLALEQLGNGQNDYARVELETLLAESPGDRRAQSLLDQLDADPETELGAKHFTTAVLPGDTMGDIAQRFLGDPIKFVILSRYNEIDVPNRLQAGDRIKIPGDRRDPLPPPVDSGQPEPGANSSEVGGLDGQPEATSPDDDFFPSVEEPTPAALPPPERSPAQVLAEARFDAEQARRRGDIDGGINILTEARNTTPLDEETNVLLASMYLDRGRRAFAEGDWDKAESDYRAGQEANPQNVRIQEQLFELETIRTANERYDEGLQLLQKDELELAYAKLSEAIGLYPELPGAQQALDGVKSPLIDRYYRQAQRQFRRQELDAALISVDKILAIDAQNSEARNLRDKVIELQERIGEFDQPER